MDETQAWNLLKTIQCDNNFDAPRGVLASLIGMKNLPILWAILKFRPKHLPHL
jgi:hypothetical protein